MNTKNIVRITFAAAIAASVALPVCPAVRASVGLAAWYLPYVAAVLVVRAFRA